MDEPRTDEPSTDTPPIGEPRLMEPLDIAAVRVLGALVEKEFTTPDNYALSLNALLADCNQSSNRDPVLEMDG